MESAAYGEGSWKTLLDCDSPKQVREKVSNVSRHSAKAWTSQDSNSILRNAVKADCLYEEVKSGQQESTALARDKPVKGLSIEGNVSGSGNIVKYETQTCVKKLLKL